MERNFKGIWIPKEIWLNENLTLQEKVMLVEIDSLGSEEKGCYASNTYFSKFFGISNSRISQIIKALVSKGYVSVNYLKENKEIIERQIHINRPPYPEVFNKLNTYLENCNGGIKYSKEGYLENAKEENIIYNNIYYNNKELNDLFVEYLKLRKRIKAVNTDRAIKSLLKKLEPYTDDIKMQMIEEALVNSWKSVYPLKNKPKVETPKWVNENITRDEMTDEELEELRKELNI